MRLAGQRARAGEALIVNDTALLVIVDGPLNTTPCLLFSLGHSRIVRIGDLVFSFALLSLLICLIVSRMSLGLIKRILNGIPSASVAFPLALFFPPFRILTQLSGIHEALYLSLSKTRRAHLHVQVLHYGEPASNNPCTSRFQSPGRVARHRIPSCRARIAMMSVERAGGLRVRVSAVKGEEYPI